MAIGGFWKNGGEECKASAGQAGRKEVGWLRIVRAGMKRMAAGGVGLLVPEGNELSCWRL